MLVEKLRKRKSLENSWPVRRGGGTANMSRLIIGVNQRSVAGASGRKKKKKKKAQRGTIIQYVDARCTLLSYLIYTGFFAKINRTHICRRYVHIYIRARHDKLSKWQTGFFFFLFVQFSVSCNRVSAIQSCN